MFINRNDTLWLLGAIAFGAVLGPTLLMRVQNSASALTSVHTEPLHSTI